tara:strand:+ start:67 stop:459 length:393 start_codon:yes stop_codon:yes gene_type:complete
LNSIKLESKTTFIGIKRLKVRCIVGLLPFERVVPQTLILNIQLCINSALIQNERKKDLLINSPNYFLLSEVVSKFIICEQFRTLETLIHDTAKLILQEYPQLQKVQIDARKPDAIPQAEASYLIEEFSRN